MLYSLATVAGIFCVPGAFTAMASETEVFRLVQSIVPLPLISMLVATGMYILNDLVDADLDRTSGKNRPIPSGRVSKQQAWAFIFFTNGLAVLLSLVTLTVVSVLLLAPMLLIGILYSAPRVALMNRFVIKTLSIATFYVLCALIGITSIYGMDLALAAPFAPAHAMALLAIMIFISSTLNDLGDVEGDRAAGRRTIPVVIGGNATVRLLMILAAAMLATSCALYNLVSLTTVVSTSLFALLVLSRLLKMKVDNIDMEVMRRQHKKLFPLHLLLQSALAVGGVVAFV